MSRSYDVTTVGTLTAGFPECLRRCRSERLPGAGPA